MRINCIGAGRVGQALMMMFDRAGFTIQGICNSSVSSSLKAIKNIGAGEPFSTPHGLPDAEVTFVTTKDDDLHQAASVLAKSWELADGRAFIHCSGLHNSQILSPLKARAGQLASVHPLISFSSHIDLSVSNFPGTLCAVEGDEEASVIAKNLMEAIGGETFTIAPDKKSLYHAAAVFPSNYVNVLIDVAKKCFMETGVTEEQAMRISTKLLSSSLNNLTTSMSPRQSLTGPIQRGDQHTIKEHIKALDDVSLSSIYKNLGRLTLDLVEQEKKEKLAELFEVVVSETDQSGSLLSLIHI